MNRVEKGREQRFFDLTFAKKEHRELIYDFLGGETFLKEQMPYVYALLDRDRHMQIKKMVIENKACFIYFWGAYDEKEKCLYLEMTASVEGYNQFSFSEIKVNTKKKKERRFRQVDLMRNRIHSRQCIKLEPEELNAISVVATMFWQNVGTGIPCIRTCELKADNIVHLTAGVQKIDLQDPVKKGAIGIPEIVISYGRKSQYQLSCDYDITNMGTKNNQQMIRIPLEAQVTLNQGTFQKVDIENSYMYLVGDKDTMLSNENMDKNLIGSGSNPFRLYMANNVDWGPGLTLTNMLNNKNFELHAGIVFQTTDGKKGLLQIQSVDNPQPYAGGYSREIPLLKLYWGCVGKDTCVEKNDGSICKISELHSGDAIKTGKAGKEGIVRDILKGYEEEIFRLETEDGRVLFLTKEHPIYCKNGWKPLCNLEIEDELYEVASASFVKLRYIYPVKYEDMVYNLHLEYQTDHGDDMGFVAEGFLCGDYEMQNGIYKDRQNKEKNMELPENIKEQIMRFLEIDK